MAGHWTPQHFDPTHWASGQWREASRAHWARRHYVGQHWHDTHWLGEEPPLVEVVVVQVVTGGHGPHVVYVLEVRGELVADLARVDLEGRGHLVLAGVGQLALAAGAPDGDGSLELSGAGDLELSLPDPSGAGRRKAGVRVVEAEMVTLLRSRH